MSLIREVQPANGWLKVAALRLVRKVSRAAAEGFSRLTTVAI